MGACSYVGISTVIGTPPFIITVSVESVFTLMQSIRTLTYLSSYSSNRRLSSDSRMKQVRSKKRKTKKHRMTTRQNQILLLVFIRCLGSPIGLTQQNIGSRDKSIIQISVVSHKCLVFEHKFVYCSLEKRSIFNKFHTIFKTEASPSSRIRFLFRFCIAINLPFLTICT